MDAANFLGTADALILSTICGHLDPPGLQAVARVIRPIGYLALQELQRQTVEMLEDDDADVREDGMIMLNRLNATARAAAAPAVMRLFAHPHRCVRRDALVALPQLLDAAALSTYAPELLDMLGDECVETCEKALSALRLMDVTALAAHTDAVLAAYEAWGDVGELEDNEAVHAMHLLELAVTLNPARLADRALDVLLQGVSAAEDVKHAAHSVLAQFDVATRNSLRPQLTALFDEFADNSGTLMNYILKAFSLLRGEELAATASRLVSAASSEGFEMCTRKEALSVMAMLKPKALAECAPALLPLLRSSCTALGSAAAVTIGYLSDAGLSEHAPAMMAMLLEAEDSERAILLCACKDLGRRALEAVTPAVVQISLSHTNPRTRTTAICLLLDLEQSALDAQAPLFLSLLRDDVSGVRNAAIMGIGSLTPPCLRQHQDALLAMLDQTDGDVRADVVWALESAMTPPELALHSHLLVALAGDRDHYVRASALHTMSALLPADVAPHTDMIVRSLRSQWEHERWYALRALNALGPQSGASLEPCVTKLLALPEPKQHEILGIRYVRTSKQHERNPHACRAAATVGRHTTASATHPIRASKRQCRRWLV